MLSGMSTKPLVIISAAGLAERADVITLLANQLEEHDIELVPEKLALAVDGLLAGPNRGAIFVARLQGRVIGVAVISYVWTLEHGGASCWLDELYVEPEHRSHGIGAMLVRAVVAHAKARGLAAIDLEVEASHARAANLYRREGFEEHSRTRYVRALGR